MEQIHHRTIHVNGIKMHLAEMGQQGPLILFLHGFPELWYSWRHQLLSLSSLGFRAVAPDLRGYGATDAPQSSAAYTALHLVGDLVGVMDEMGEEKAYVVGHDMGAVVGWWLCLLRPDRVMGYVAMSVPFRPRHPKVKPVQGLRWLYGDDYYICRFQEEGDIEEEMAKRGTKQVLRSTLCCRSTDPPMLPKGKSFMAPPSQNGGVTTVAATTAALPGWLAEDDLNYYASKYEQTGFTGALNQYRALDLSWELTAAWTGAKVKVPVKYIVGDMDMVYHMAGIQDYVHNGAFRRDVPLLHPVVILHGAAHFISQERPDEVTHLIYDFISHL